MAKVQVTMFGMSEVNVEYRSWARIFLGEDAVSMM